MATTTDLITRLIGLLVAAASLPTLLHLHLAPIYGALPASAHHQILTNITVLASILIGPLFVSSKVLKWALPIAILRPVLQQVLQYSTRHAGITLGPPLIEVLLSMPLLFLLVDRAQAALVELWLYTQLGWGTVFVPSVLIAGLLLFQAWARTYIPLICATGHVLLSRRALQLLLSDLRLISAITRGHGARLTRVLGMSLALLATILSQTYNSKQIGNEWKILAHGESVTGYISVLENTELQYRLLRCDHSLLGGEWLLTEQRQRNEGWQVTEPVFDVFAMLEAVRLVRRPSLQGTVQKNDAETSALVM